MSDNTIRRLAKEIARIMKESGSRKTSPYDTQATVRRVEDGVAWVQIPGGVDETPVRLTIDAKEGDSVQVRVSGGKAWITGNASAPPTDDGVAYGAAQAASDAGWKAQAAEEGALNAQRTAKDAAEAAVSAQNSANIAGQAADSALVNLAEIENVVGTLNWITAHGTMTLTTDVAIDPTHVYFVRDPNGNYHVGDYYYTLVTEPKAEELSTYYVLTVDESIQNYVATHVAVDAEGLWLLPETSGACKVLIATGSGTVHTTPGTYIIDSSNVVVAKFTADSSRVGPIKSGASRAEIDTSGIAFITRLAGLNYDSKVAYLGYDPDYSGSSQRRGPYFTFGSRMSGTVLGTWSVAMGCIANVAGHCSVGEGYNAIVTGDYAHAEGYGCAARGDYSHAEGSHTDADSDYQHVLGRYNKVDSNGEYAFIIGNGTASDSRSNAMTVDWDGNIKCAGSDVMPLIVVDNANANDLTSTGLYHVKATLSNFPRTNWGLLVVQDFGTLFQLYFPDATAEIWRRHYSGGAWTSWLKVTFS